MCINILEVFAKLMNSFINIYIPLNAKVYIKLNELLLANNL